MQFMVIDKKKYLLKKSKHRQGDYKLELIPYNEKEYDTIAEEIAEKIEKVVDKKTLIKQALAPLEYDQILKIHKLLTKDKIKPVAKKGCYEIKIGKTYLGLIE